MIDQSALHRLLDYDPLTGIFRWKAKRRGIKAGAIAGTPIHGYWLLRLSRKHYYAHRLAWFYVYGVWPKQIDHIDMDKQNNAIDNLREASTAQNGWNRGAQSNNKSGLKGVKTDRNGSFTARITRNGNHVRLGSFRSAEAAHQAYLQVVVGYHGEFARGK